MIYPKYFLHEEAKEGTEGVTGAATESALATASTETPAEIETPAAETTTTETAAETTTTETAAETTTTETAAETAAESSTTETVEEFEIAHEENSPLTDTQFNTVMDFVEKNGLNEEQAKSFLKMHEDTASNSAASVHTKRAAENEALKNKLINDPEFGGAKFAESLKIMALPVQQFGDEDLNALLSSEIGNQPALARFIYKIGNAMKSEGFVGKGGKPVAKEENILEKMYPSFYKND